MTYFQLLENRQLLNAEHETMHSCLFDEGHDTACHVPVVDAHSADDSSASLLSTVQQFLTDNIIKPPYNQLTSIPVLSGNLLGLSLGHLADVIFPDKGINLNKDGLSSIGCFAKTGSIIGLSIDAFNAMILTNSVESLFNILGKSVNPEPAFLSDSIETGFKISFGLTVGNLLLSSVAYATQNDSLKFYSLYSGLGFSFLAGFAYTAFDRLYMSAESVAV